MQEIGWLVMAVTFAVGVLACLPGLWQKYRHNKAMFEDWKRRRERENRQPAPCEGSGCD